MGLTKFKIKKNIQFSISENQNVLQIIQKTLHKPTYLARSFGEKAQGPRHF